MKKYKIIRKKIEEGEGVWDSISAFGRQAADTATLGGYKYARAGVDYAAKNALSLAGYGKGTTYQKELDQEKEKLAHDEAEHQQASSAGKLAGMGAMALAPELPVAGPALAAGEKASKFGTIINYARKAIGLEEDVPVNATGDAVQTNVVFKPMRPMARRGKFLNQETFIISSTTFNSLREAKKSGKHWRTYLNEDDAYHDLREYAKKCKGPIIVEDERTGACMYVRYGKGGSLKEAWTNKVSRSGARYLSDAGSSIQAVGEFENVKKIGNYNKTHSIYSHDSPDDDGWKPRRHYHLVHNESGHITHSVNGSIKNNVLSISGAGSSEENKKLGTKVKMEDFYHHLLKKGAQHEASGSKETNKFPVAIKGTSHSGPSEDEEGDYGAQKVWRNLAKKPRTTIHGFVGGKKGKPINVGKAEDPSETHADPQDFDDWTGEPKKGTDPERTQVGKMALVASVNLPKKKKFRYVVKRRGR